MIRAPEHVIVVPPLFAPPMRLAGGSTIEKAPTGSAPAGACVQSGVKRPLRRVAKYHHPHYHEYGHRYAHEACAVRSHYSLSSFSMCGILPLLVAGYTTASNKCQSIRNERLQALLFMLIRAFWNGLPTPRLTVLLGATLKTARSWGCPERGDNTPKASECLEGGTRNSSRFHFARFPVVADEPLFSG